LLQPINHLALFHLLMPCGEANVLTLIRHHPNHSHLLTLPRPPQYSVQSQQVGLLGQAPLITSRIALISSRATGDMTD